MEPVRLQPRIRDCVQSSLLLHLCAAELGRSILRHQQRYSLPQRHTLQNPDGTPALGIALPLGDAGRPHLLVLPQLPAGQNDPDALRTRLHTGYLTVPPPQPPVLAVLDPARGARCSHKAGEVAGREHAGEDTGGGLKFRDGTSAPNKSARRGY